METRILIVDEDMAIRRLLRTTLCAHGYHVLQAATASDALAQLTGAHPSAVLLDLDLPDLDGHSDGHSGGLAALRDIRRLSRLPVIALSARAEEPRKVAALDLGADDYVTKPFGLEELLARLQAALRHGLQQEGIDPHFHAGALRVDLVRHEVTLDGHPVALTGKEYALLEALLLRGAGRTVTHKTLLQAVWGPAHLDDVQYLRTCVQALRRKLEQDPHRPAYLLTEPRIGYRLRPPD